MRPRGVPRLESERCPHRAQSWESPSWQQMAGGSLLTPAPPLHPAPALPFLSPLVLFDFPALWVKLEGPVVLLPVSERSLSQELDPRVGRCRGMCWLWGCRVTLWSMLWCPRQCRQGSWGTGRPADGWFSSALLCWVRPGPPWSGQPHPPQPELMWARGSSAQQRPREVPTLAVLGPMEGAPSEQLPSIT